MNPKVSYFLVGLFVIALGTLSVAGAIWLGTSQADERYDPYIAYMYESVGGLEESSEVTYRGVEVGYVGDIELDRDNPQRVRLVLQIREGIPIKEDTEAILVTQGLTGLAHVELTGGSPDSPLLRIRDGEDFPEIQTGPSLLVRLDATATSLVNQLTNTAQYLNGVAERVEQLLGDNNQRAIANTLRNIEQISADLSRQIGGLDSTIDHLDQIMANAAVASEEWPSLMPRLRQALSATEEAMDSVGVAARDISGTANDFSRTAEVFEVAVGEMTEGINEFTQGTPTQVQSLLAELQLLTQGLQRLTMELEQDPNMLLFGRPPTQPGPGEGE
ncbi:MAG: MCE family protein [Myxococcales bacterium]|nr:MCE family protein [Myxococcales bacterium]